MSNELLATATTGQTLYVLLIDATGQVYNGSTFETPADVNWSTYDIAMTEAGTTGIYRASMLAVSAGAYSWLVYKQAGASPAVGDTVVGSGTIRWTGTAEETVPASANVTMQAGVAVAAADANGNVPVVLYPTQGAVTFGQVKILANVPNQGALHVVNRVASGHGQYIEGGYAGQYNNGGNMGQYNQGGNYGQTNSGPTPVAGAASQEIADALKRAPAAGTPAVGSVYDLLAGIEEDTGTTLPATLALEATAQAILLASGGSRTYSYSNTVDDGSGNLLDGVFIQLATDSAFTNVINTTHTNSLGAFTVYSDIPGTHYLRLQRGDMTFTDQTVTLA